MIHACISSREALLRRLETDGPLDLNQVDALCHAERERILREAGELLLNRVSLLDGYEPEDLGHPMDWFRAPRGDLQWSTHLSRHYWLLPLGYAYRATNEAHYAKKIIGVLVDWVDRFPIGVNSLDRGRADWTNPPTDPDRYEMFYPGYCDGPWTSLSAHARFDSWSALLQLIADSDVISEGVAEKIAASLFDVHVPLMIDFPRKMNQFQSIANSLVTCGWYYPDVDISARAQRIGWERMAIWVEAEIYPDGSIAECSHNYGVGCVRRLQNLIEKATRLEEPIPAEFPAAFARAVRYLALTTDPTGHCPRLAKGAEDMVEQFKAMKLDDSHSEAAFVVDAASASQPEPLNFVFPWAGHAVARSDWSAEAAWVFFDMGPRGSGHCDWAQLGLQLCVGADPILVDPGYFSYSRHGEEGQMAIYLNSTAAHNTALVDGCGQTKDPQGVVKGPNLVPGEYAHRDESGIFSASALYENGYGEQGEITVVHERTITFNRQAQTLEVEDRFEGEGSHRVQLHWHLTPGSSTDIRFNAVHATFNRTQFQLAFEGDTELSIERFRGSKEPLLGWCSDHYGQLEATDTVVVSSHADLPLIIKSTIAWSSVQAGAVDSSCSISRSMI